MRYMKERFLFIMSSFASLSFKALILTVLITSVVTSAFWWGWLR